jgi:acyl carrier protein
MENIENRLKSILIDFGIDQSKISKDSDYYFDLNLDILDLMGLAKRIKNEFMISIPDNEILRMERISDTIYFLEKKSRLKVLHN